MTVRAADPTFWTWASAPGGLIATVAGGLLVLAIGWATKRFWWPWLAKLGSSLVLTSKRAAARWAGPEMREIPPPPLHPARFEVLPLKVDNDLGMELRLVNLGRGHAQHVRLEESDDASQVQVRGAASWDSIAPGTSVPVWLRMRPSVLVFGATWDVVVHWRDANGEDHWRELTIDPSAQQLLRALRGRPAGPGI